MSADPTWLRLELPELARKPLIVEVPHAGLVVPSDIKAQTTLSHDNILRDADMYVDELYAAAPQYGATLLSTKLSRYVVDLNRAEDDVDPRIVSGSVAVNTAAQPRGVIWTITTEGKSVFKQPLTPIELEQRLKTYYRPYHQTLLRLIREDKTHFGYSVILAAHSMPSVGRQEHRDSGVKRADIVPGTQGRSTADKRLIDLVDTHFRSGGLSVMHDDPYSGGFTTKFYGTPGSNQHAVQIEINRALYMNETTFEKIEPNFTELKKLLTALVEKMSALSLT
jgi:N-formylglutamate deformylase